MKKNEKLMFFLGQVHAMIQSLSTRACDSEKVGEELFEQITDLEQFFNKEIVEIFAMIDDAIVSEKSENNSGKSSSVGLMLWS